MKFGLLTAILEGTTFEEAVDFAAENQLECLEVACWPNTGGAKRRYAGVCHIDAEALTEEKAKEILLEKEIEILIDLNDGKFSSVAWGCDLTYDYVRINGDYRS